MRKWVLCSIVSVGLGLLGGCLPPPPTSPYEFDLTNNNTVQNIKVRTYVNINLPGNPTTGFTWTVGTISNPFVAQFVGSSYTPDSTGLIGSGGQYVFSYQVTGIGQTTITLNELPPGSQVPSNTYKLTLIAQ